MPVVNASFLVQLYLYGYGIIEKITYIYDTSLSTLDVYFFFHYLTKSFSVEVKIVWNEVRGSVLLLFLPIVPQSGSTTSGSGSGDLAELS